MIYMNNFKQSNMKLKELKKKELIKLVKKIDKAYTEAVVDNIELEEEFSAFSRKYHESKIKMSKEIDVSHRLIGEYVQEVEKLRKEVKELKEKNNALEEKNEYLKAYVKVVESSNNDHLTEAQWLSKMSIWQFLKWRKSNA